MCPVRHTLCDKGRLIHEFYANENTAFAPSFTIRLHEIEWTLFSLCPPILTLRCSLSPSRSPTRLLLFETACCQVVLCRYLLLICLPHGMQKRALASAVIQTDIARMEIRRRGVLVAYSVPLQGLWVVMWSPSWDSSCIWNKTNEVQLGILLLWRPFRAGKVFCVCG